MGVTSITRTLTHTGYFLQPGLGVRDSLVNVTTVAVLGYRILYFEKTYGIST